MKKLTFFLAAALLCPALSSAAEVKADADTLFSLGFLLGRNLAMYDFSSKELKEVEKGLEAAARGEKPKGDLSAGVAKIQAMGMERWKAKADAEKSKSDKFLADTAKEAGVQKLEDGILVKQIKPGTGEAPTVKDTVKVHYEGTLRDGKVFDSSRQRGEPISFPLENVVPCWQKALAAMKKGGEAKIFCPAATAYGEMGQPPVIPGNAALVFSVELLDVQPPAPEAKPEEKKEEPKAPAKEGKPSKAKKSSKKK